MTEDDERAHLEARFGRFGPWVPRASDLPPGGPQRVWRGSDAVAWIASAGRWRAEREGRARVPEHAAMPAVLEEDELGWVLAPYGDAVADPLRAVLASGAVDRRRLEGTRRALLEALAPDVAVNKGLGRVGITRRRVDRWLGEEVSVETAVGPSLGGVRSAWWRTQGGRTVALRWDRARADGWLAMDLAALTLDGVDDDDAREAHRRGADDAEAADRAHVLAALAVALREHAITKDEVMAARARAILGRPSPRPTTVRVWIEGPPVVPPELWHRPGEEVSDARARWLLAHLDGVHVAGGQLSVRTEPPLRRGRRTPQREPRGVRRRRLFARWDEGVRVDDEGLTGATPEALALRIANGAKGIVLDGTCGAGALTIAYARQPDVERVIAVDVDPERLSMARHNARIYGVEDRVEWIAGDVVEVLGTRRADLLVLDPPWGGRAYDRERVELDALGMDVRAALARHDGAVVLKLPRSFDPTTLPEGAWRLEPLVDDRGILKMMIAEREPRTER